MTERVLSGMQPSGAFHLGNWMGALDNWIRLQDGYRCYFMVADWHALTSGYHNTAGLPDLTRRMVVDWLSVGLDPKRSVLFVQSTVSAHAELFLLLSMTTPLGWLERVPSYKEKLRELEQREIHTYGFLGYPVLQAADILLYQAQWVPVGLDQVPHVELTREMARRFNHLYGPTFTEPEALLTEARVLPGLDGKKMSKSYGNTIALGDAGSLVLEKVRTMVTDPARVKRTDPGHPEVCPVFHLHRYFSSDVGEIAEDCRNARIGCVDCKVRLAENLNRRLDPIRDRRAYWEAHPDEVSDILHAGGQTARTEAERTMDTVRQAMHLTEGREKHHDGSAAPGRLSG